jgi:hypothetical protein
VKYARNLIALGVVAVLGVAIISTGCKSVPELTKENALALIQAKYDQSPAAAITILLNKQAMGQGIVANYWQLSKVYPNRYWADYTLTPQGKKFIKLPAGGDVIQWRPDSSDATAYVVSVSTVATAHLKAKDLGDLSDQTVAGVSTAKGGQFSEAVNLDSLPSELQNIAHNTGNKLSSKHQAIFSYENGAWVLHSVV